MKRKVLAGLPHAQRLTAFYNGWTRKEAFIKALGGSLSVDLDQFDVTMTQDEPARLLRLHASRGSVQDWSLISLQPTPGCMAAIAVASSRCRIKVCQWTSARR